MLLTERLEDVAQQYNPQTDVAYAARDLKHGEGVIRAGDPLPTADFDADKVRQFVRVKFAKVVFGAKAVSVAAVKTEKAKPDTEGGVACEVCGRTFKTKLNLGAHKRSHKG